MSSQGFLPHLESLLFAHRTSELFAALDVVAGDSSASPTPPEERARLAIIFAKALEFGHDCARAVRHSLNNFSAPDRSGLSSPGIARFDLATAILLKHDQRFDEALVSYELALVRRKLLPAELVVYGLLGKSNIARKMALYEDAIPPAVEAHDLALRSGLDIVAADADVVIAWLRFETANNAKARELLANAMPVMREAGDHRRCGDIEGALGRIDQRSGDLEQAAAHLDRSLEFYGLCPVEVANKGRALIVAAKIEWLRGRRLNAALIRAGEQASHGAAWLDRKDVSYARVVEFALRAGGVQEFLAELRSHLAKSDRHLKEGSSEARAIAEARASHFDRAAQLLRSAIAVKSNRHRGLGRIRVIAAYLLAETGDLKAAAKMAGRAAARSESKHRLQHARACVQQVMMGVLEVRRASVTAEKLPNHVDSLVTRALRVIELVSALQERRIKVKAFTWYCEAELLCAHPDLERIENAWRAADELLLPMPGDYVTEDHESARRHINAAWAARGDNAYLIRLASHVPDEKWADIAANVKRILVLRTLAHLGSDAQVAKRLSVAERDVRAIRNGRGGFQPGAAE